ncbi:MAG: hypothetical protein AVDCRST_MAG11-1637, partial [uncultured Gemmatimonadaceae bacterium]
TPPIASVVAAGCPGPRTTAMKSRRSTSTRSPARGREIGTTDCAAVSAEVRSRSRAPPPALPSNELRFTCADPALRSTSPTRSRSPLCTRASTAAGSSASRSVSPSSAREAKLARPSRRAGWKSAARAAGSVSTPAAPTSYASTAAEPPTDVPALSTATVRIALARSA